MAGGCRRTPESRTREDVARHVSLERMVVEFTFLMCSERCGSNLITRLLDAHPQVCGPATKHLLNPVARNLFRYEPLAERDNWNALLDDVHRLLAADFSSWRHAFTRESLQALAEPGDAAALLRAIFTTEAQANGKAQVFVKENQVYEFIAFLLLHFPQARYVYQVRDPRDMALSWKNNPGHPGGVCRAARQWQADQQNTLKIFTELHRRGQAERVRYEELISHPQAALEPVLAMLGLRWEPSMLAFHESDLTRENAARQHAWANLDKALMRDNKHKYRQSLSADEIRAVEAICRFEMPCLGYTCESTAAELERFARDELAAFERRDNHSKLHRPGDGVQANSEAKRRFYQHLPLQAA